MAICLVAVLLAGAMFYCLGVLPRSTKLARTAAGALAALTTPSLSDRDKELAARKASLQLFRGGSLVLALSVTAILPSILLLGLLVRFRLLSGADIITTLFSYRLMLAALLVVMIGWLCRKWMISHN